MLTILISSTFLDMQAERDAIRNHVAPVLRQVAARYGESVRVLDLRWGIDTASLSEQEASERVLDICLDEIDRCRGHMICLLGNRYGWVPDYNTLDILRNRKLSLPYPVSITELEIQYGILQRSSNLKNVVFLRDAIEHIPEDLQALYEDPIPDERLVHLKQQLKNSPMVQCEHYTLSFGPDGTLNGIDQFVSRITEALTIWMEDIFKGAGATTPMQQLRNQFNSICAEYAEGYLPVPVLEEDLLKFQDSDMPFWIIRGDEGMGKTSFCARLYNHPPDVTVIPFFCNNTAWNSSPKRILEYFTSALADLAPDVPLPEQGNEDDLRQCFTEQLKQVPKPLWIVIDSLDQIGVSSERALAWIPTQLIRGIRFVLTDCSQYGVSGHISELWLCQESHIPFLEDPRSVIERMLEAHGKTVAAEILDSIAAHPLSCNYLFCNMIVQMLTQLDRRDYAIIRQSGGTAKSIHNYLLAKLQDLPDTMDQMAFLLMFDCGEQVAPGIAANVLPLIASSPIGLRAQDLQSILKDMWNEAAFSRLELLLHGYIQEDTNGFYRFVRPMIKNSCLNAGNNTHFRLLATYIRSLSNDDPFKIVAGLRPMLRCGWTSQAIGLILKNQESQELQLEFISCLSSFPTQIAAILREKQVMDWFLDKAIHHVMEAVDVTHAIELLKELLPATSVELRIRMSTRLAELYILLGNKREAWEIYRQLLDHLEKHADPLVTARQQSQLARLFYIDTDHDLERLKQMLLAASETFASAGPLSREDILNSVRCSAYLLIMQCEEYFPSHITKMYAITDLINKRQYVVSHWGYFESVIHFGSSRTSLHDCLQPETLLNSLNKLLSLTDDLIPMIETPIYAAATELLGMILDYLLKFGTYKRTLDLSGFPEDYLNRFQKFADSRDVVIASVYECYNQFAHTRYQAHDLMLLAEILIRLAATRSNLDEETYCRELACRIYRRHIHASKHSILDDHVHDQYLELANCYLKQQNYTNYEQTLNGWLELAYNSVRMKCMIALIACRKYPDEVHEELLTAERDHLDQILDEYHLRYCLREDYFTLNRIRSNHSLYNLRWCVSSLKMVEAETNIQDFHLLMNMYHKLDAHSDADLPKTDQTRIMYVRRQLKSEICTVLTMLEAQVSDQTEHELLRPCHYYRMTAAHYMEYILLLNQTAGMTKTNLRIQRLRYSMLAAIHQVKLCEHDLSMENRAALALETLNLLLTIDSYLEDDEEIRRTWLYPSVSAYEVRFLYIRCLMVLAAESFQACTYPDTFRHSMLVLDLVIQLWDDENTDLSKMAYLKSAGWQAITWAYLCIIKSCNWRDADDLLLRLELLQILQ